MDEFRQVMEWAKGLVEQGFLVIDTETTGLGRDDEVVQVGIINHFGEVLLDTLVRPQNPDRLLAKGPSGRSSADIHGITPDKLRSAPTFREIYPALVALMTDNILVAYNADFDRRLLQQSCTRWEMPMPVAAAWHCAMKQHAVYFGEIKSDGEYRWQRLGGDHSALGDVRATLALVNQMATGKSPTLRQR